jgi:predicted ABC-type ATPase
MPQTGAAGRPFIFVLAGVNGAGKSSVGGSILMEHGLSWFNPDTYARELMVQLGMDTAKANGLAWGYGRSKLEAAMAQRTSYAFETTLGGRTIADMLAKATRTHDVMMFFCGLSSPEQHIERVRLRVANGGHDIPEGKIRERWTGSRVNLIKLIPHLARLQVFDNSTEALPGQDIPDPLLVMETINGHIVFPKPEDATILNQTPQWARSIVQAAIEISS